MTENDNSQLWRLAWTILAVAIVGGGALSHLDSSTLGILAGISSTIIAGVWIKRPGDTAPPSGGAQ